MQHSDDVIERQYRGFSSKEDGLSEYSAQIGQDAVTIYSNDKINVIFDRNPPRVQKINDNAL